MLDAAIAAGIKERIGASEFARWMGLELLSVADGESELTLTLQPHHLNPGGIAHGGIIATILDAAIGVALRTRLDHEHTHVTVQLNVNYLKPIRSGVMIARGRAIHSGARTGFGEAELLDDSNHLLAKGSGTFVVVPVAEIPAGSDHEERVEH